MSQFVWNVCVIKRRLNISEVFRVRIAWKHRRVKHSEIGGSWIRIVGPLYVCKFTCGVW